MKSVVIASRSPWPSFSGDRLRTTAWVEALSALGTVTLVAPVLRQQIPPEVKCELVRVPGSVTSLIPRMAKVIGTLQPITSLLSAGFAWKKALSDAMSQGGPFDVAVVVLSRLDPWVRRYLHAECLIVDAIDSLGASYWERARHAKGPQQHFWRHESHRMGRYEQQMGARYDAITVVAEAEAASFGDKAVVIPLGVKFEALTTTRRDIDVAFWGRLGYFANRDAASWLTREIWPRVRRACPDASLLIGGADAPGWLRRLDGQHGITVHSPMEGRSGLLRRVRVTCIPMRFGTGISTKALEAAEAGCSIVATPLGLRGVETFMLSSLVETEAQELADAVVSLLANPDCAASGGKELRQLAESQFSWDLMCHRMQEVAMQRSLLPLS